MRDYTPEQHKTRFERGVYAVARTRYAGRVLLALATAFDRRILRVSRGRLKPGLGQPVALLHVRGARTGVERTVPLLATKTGEVMLFVASGGGAGTHPAWYWNVRANPDVDVTIDGERVPMRAEVASRRDTRERWWPLVCDHYRGYATYQRRAAPRAIPVVVLRSR